MLFNNSKYPPRPRLLGGKQEERLPMVIVGCICACFLKDSGGIWGGLILFFIWFLFACYGSQKDWEAQCDVGFPSWQGEHGYVSSMGYYTEYGKGTHDAKPRNQEEYEFCQRQIFRQKVLKMECRSAALEFFGYIDHFPQLKDDLFEALELDRASTLAMEMYNSMNCPEYKEASKKSNEKGKEIRKKMRDIVNSSPYFPSSFLPTWSGLGYLTSKQYTDIIALRPAFEKYFYEKGIMEHFRGNGTINDEKHYQDYTKNPYL